MGGDSKPWCGCGKAHPDTGERTPELIAWAEVYDLRGRLLGLLVCPAEGYVEDWARGRPAGSRYRVIARGGGRMLSRMTVVVAEGGRIGIEDVEVGR